MRTALLPLLVATALAIPALALPAPAQDDSSHKKLGFKNDQTGLDWVLPFKQALAKARKQKRLLVIKPIAFGTSRDGGW